MLRSQKIRESSYQLDSLRMGMGWTREDCYKPHILVESAEGDSHPGSSKLGKLKVEAIKGIEEKGGRPVKSYVTDICDGIAQGHDGINYSLASREIMADMVEIHAQAEQHDAIVLISTCDKSIPSHLMAAARINIPAIHVPGGSMNPGENMIMQGDITKAAISYKKKEISKKQLEYVQQQACQSCGACQFMGTASTMQAVSEALGMALPTSALAPFDSEHIKKISENSGKQILRLLEKNIKPRDILTKEAFENAIIIHTAIGGSTNALLHIPAIAHEAGLDIDFVEMFERYNKEIPYLTNIHTSGKYPAQFLWYAGGVYKIFQILKEHVHLDALTVTGKTVGENLEELEKSRFFEDNESFFTKNKIKRTDVLKDENNEKGSIAILKGNLAEQGAVVKYSGISPEMHKHIGKAVVFDKEENAHQAILNEKIAPGNVIVIRYEGPKAAGMPELYYTTEALALNKKLEKTAIVTDGRFSGATRGASIGHVSPEAYEGGNIALVEDDDLIEIDIPNRRLNIIGIMGKRENIGDIENILNTRRKRWKQPEQKYKKGVMALYTSLAASAMKGVYIET